MKIFIKDNDDSYHITPLLGLTRAHDIAFHLEKNHWTFVKSIKEADIVPVMNAPFKTYLNDTITLEDQFKFVKSLRNDQYILMLYYTHASETFNTDVKNRYMAKWSSLTENVLTVDLNSCYEKNDHRHIYTNFSFNLVKALFTEYDNYDFKPGRLWTGHTSKSSFVLGDISYFKPTKRFLIPNIIRSTGTLSELIARSFTDADRTEFKEVARRAISDKIIKDEDCFYSDHTRDIFLDPEESSEYFLARYNPTGSNLIPIKNSYYTESIVSVYSETIGTGKYGVNTITEKTYIPLVKGHFIMPFSYKGIIKDIENFGFKLPKWIDYSYDMIDNDIERLEAFIASVSKLRQMSLEDLTTLANNDIDIVKYNRSLFYTKSYDSLFNKVKLSVHRSEKIRKGIV